jgi:glycosyltransferase involved in cell wall biosynthesis
VKSKPIRILEVVGGMNRGGVETWLMHILRHIDRERFRIDFLVATENFCAYDEEIRALGSNILTCLYPKKPLLYAHNFTQIVRRFGPYDIVHGHEHHYNGYISRLSAQIGVPARIAHSHSDTSSLDAKASLSRCGYLLLMRRWISTYSTRGLAASHEAAGALFGPNWRANSRWEILHCGIDLSSFQKRSDPASMRSSLGISQDAFVLGHVGRLVEPKNHSFLLDIAWAVAKREPNMHLLLVGDGPLRPDIEQKVAQLGLTDKVIFAGERSDVSQLMLSAMDVFVLPSSHEGLPLVGMEVQAAGLPFVLSDNITQEVDVVKPLIKRLSLSQPADVWADAILKMRESDVAISQADALALMQNSSFSIEHSLKKLIGIYTNAR